MALGGMREDAARDEQPHNPGGRLFVYSRISLRSIRATISKVVIAALHKENGSFVSH